MQKVVSENLWTVIQRLAVKAKYRKAAVAYVTQDLIGLRADDILVVDASKTAISCGETDARLLRTLFNKGVRLFNCLDLHAKVLILGDSAVIGSGNMSNSSAKALVEAAIITDHVSTVSGASSFIEQLIEQSEKLDKNSIAHLCKIKVVRKGGRLPNQSKSKRKTKVAELGNQTWLLAVPEMGREPTPSDQVMIERAAKELKPQIQDPEDLEYLRWGTKSRFARECKAGDTVIQMWRSSSAKRTSTVFRAVPVLLKQQGTSRTFFYLEPTRKPGSELSWGKFKNLLKSLAYPRAVGPNTEHLVDPDMADAIARKWKSAK